LKAHSYLVWSVSKAAGAVVVVVVVVVVIVVVVVVVVVAAAAAVVESWLVNQSRIAVAEVQRQLKNPEKGECLPLETVRRKLVMTKQA
jgi:hypothetical protein